MIKDTASQTIWQWKLTSQEGVMVAQTGQHASTSQAGLSSEACDIRRSLLSFQSRVYDGQEGATGSAENLDKVASLFDGSKRLR